MLLQSDNLDVRLKAVKFLGNVFSSSDNPIHGSFRPLFVEFLKRLTDRVSEVRIAVIEHVKNLLISDPSRSEAQEIICKKSIFGALHEKKMRIINFLKRNLDHP